MNKNVLSAVFAVATVLLIQNFWGAKKEVTTQRGVITLGQVGDVAHTSVNQDLYRPFDREVIFNKEQSVHKEEFVELETNYVGASLATYGGVLTDLHFKEHRGKHDRPLRTVYQKGSFTEEGRKQGCFLIALDGPTPYFYRFTDQHEDEVFQQITCQASNDDCTIVKTYVFDKKSYKMDMIVTIEPHNKSTQIIRPRLFFNAPLVPEIADDVLQLCVLPEGQKSLAIKELADAAGSAWFWPTSNILFGAVDKYFMHAVVADQDHFVQRAYCLGKQAGTVQAVLEGPQVTEKKTWRLSFYLGPKVYDHLEYVDGRLRDVLNFGWLSWLCKLILMLLEWLYSFVKNYGIAIILLTIILRLPFVPLSLYSRNKMNIYQKHQPFINRIRLKFKHDMQKQQEEIMRYHREHNLSPAMPLIGCLPLLIQLPILFSLYRILHNYLDLYQAPFFGWIVDLSAYDPYYLLPVLMGVTMLWQQHLTPVGDEKQRGMMWFMSIFMTVLFAKFPAGLVLYWLMNNVLTIAEDYLRRALFKA